MKNDKYDKVQIKNLLQVYSLEDVFSLFSKIDQKIISLHEYSSEDFLMLNNDFKKHSKVASKISDNASYLFEFLADEDKHYFTSKIDELYNHLNSKNSLLEYNMEIAYEGVNTLLSHIRRAFFPIKNFKQNLTSLRFLETNLEFDYNNETGIETQVIGGISGKAKEQLVLIEKSFHNLKQIIKTDFNGKDDQLEELNFKNILKKLESEMATYREHFDNAGKKIPEIKERTEKTTDNISKIITNLQYHDIIKQKMEHIQETHRELVCELDNLSKQEDINDLNTQAKYFIRIRDIAGLQAAQLMQTNKEYQTAIQRISDKFLSIGDDMTYVTKQCAAYTSFDSEQQRIFFNSLKNNLSVAKTEIQNFCEYYRNFHEKIKKINTIIDKVFSFNENISLLIEDIEKFIDLVTNNIKDNSSKGHEKIFSQIDQLYHDLKSNKENLDDIINKIVNIRENLEMHVLSEVDNDQLEDKTSELPGKIEEYINGLNEIEGKIVEKLTENNDLSESLLSDIQKSVNQIQYYDFFEDIVEGIIDELNTINYKLRFDEDNVQNKEENLKKLTEYYTMNSEFLIHEQVTNGSQSEIEVSEDGGDLELF